MEKKSKKSANDEIKATGSFKYSLVNLRQVHVVFMTSLTIFTAYRKLAVLTCVPRWRGKNEVIMRGKYQLNLNKIVSRNEDLKRKRYSQSSRFFIIISSYFRKRGKNVRIEHRDSTRFEIVTRLLIFDESSNLLR